MSLKIIYGTAGSGKTSECFEFVSDIIEKTNSNVIYMVPEQYSLQAERTVSSAFSRRAMDRIEVLSFERLAGRVFSQVGPVVCDFVDDNAKLMFVEKVLIKLSGKLSYFGKNADVSGFASVVLDTIKLFKTNCISADDLKRTYEETDSTLLKYKLYDLIMIYEEYNKLFVYPYADSEDNMIRIAEKIEKYKLFTNTHIVMDNYNSFSKQQLEVIAVLMRNCPTVTVTLTADNLNYRDNFQLFYKSKQTAQILRKIAQDSNVSVLPDMCLCADYDECNELGFLCDNYFNLSKKSYTDKTKQLYICKSGNYNTEIEQIASEIHRLVREENYRYRDIAVITRSPQVYYPIIEDVFGRYGIFCNTTAPVLSDNTFLYQAMMSVFEIVVSNYAFEPVFDFVNSVLCSLSDYDKHLLENYVIETGNTQKLWNSDDEIVFQGKFSDKDFYKIKKLIEYVRNCIFSFTNKFKGRKKVSEIADAYSEFLAYIDAENTVAKLVSSFKNNGDNQTANLITAVYNHIIDSINRMVLYFGDTNITFEKFLKILKAGLANTELDRIPSGVDDVQVTTIDRFQSSNAKIVFAAGISDGVIPCGYINEGILKDNELKQIGIEESVMQKHCDENYVIYRMFASASDKLYLSYPMADNEGEGIMPSSIIGNVKKIFPNVSELQNLYIKTNAMEEVEGVIPTFNKVVSNGNYGFWSTVSDWYRKNKPELYDIIVNSANYQNQPKKLTADTVKKLYGEEINTSISRIEKYNQCAFAYFVRYGLNVDERKTFKIDPRDYGSYMHEIIEEYSKFAEAYGWKNITEELCYRKAVDITERILNENLSGFYTESKRHKYLFNKIIETMKTVLWNVTGFYKESGYVTLGYEIDFDEKGEFEPITVTLSDGTVAKLRGKIDRTDVRRTENGDFICIVDYKSSAKNINYEKILCGIQIQLPVYISAVCENLKKRGDNVFPAAMLYYHIDEPIVTGDRNLTDEEINKQLLNALKMQGITLETSGIPFTYVAKNSATGNQLEKMCRTAYNQVKRALEKMTDGNISISPVLEGKSSACDYCPYGNICNFDTCFENNKYRNYRKLKKEEFFEYVDEMDN